MNEVHQHEVPYLRGVPRPTSGPMFAALGLTLLFAGMVTTIAVSVVGVTVFLLGLIVWWRTCLPEESVHQLPAGCEIPLPLGAAASAVAVAGPRHVLPLEVHPYRAGVSGGLIGGVSMAAVACAWGLVEHSSIWLPINLLAGTVSPAVVGASEADLSRLEIAWLMLALMIHLFMSVFVGLLYAVCLPIMPRRPILFGGVITPVFITGIAWSTMGVVNPALEQFISWPWFGASQLAFGMVCGWWVSRSARIPAMASFGLGERMGVERSRGGDR